ncbi:hypothetical protein FGO68_gene17308 [Halteria grandinella]|uniref:PHR domain-containing protein n=1 Tax=Halteria grandinella TaxID=5974 RepID=A0A8J8T4N4_HALGN|nr:hypothetical protein FGO68_gene17308 [Halteria grandinella]
MIMNFFVYEFQKHKNTGIFVEAGSRLHYAQWIEFSEGNPRTFNARKDKRPVKIEDDFKIMNSKLDKNGTTNEDGIIPAILYAYTN